ncbi:MAG: GlsB/YeaQ/YmgE family stress response membrane protein [Solirubrobacterales bacterium]
MGILGWILLGLFAGTIARAIIPGQTEPGGCIGTTAIGILGALLGGFLATALDIGEIDDFFDLGTWLIAIAGSALLLLLIRAFSR